MKRYIDPSVNIISSNRDMYHEYSNDKTNFGIGYDLWLKSRRSIVSRGNTGLTVGNETIEDETEYVNRIRKMNLQYMNNEVYTLEFQGSVLFRDILFTLNKCGCWAESLRFVNSTLNGFNEGNYPISSEYKDIPEWEEQFNKYMLKCIETMITDENRVEMPYSVTSKYWVTMNWKTLITFLSMLKLKMPFFYNIYGKLIEDDFENKYDIRLTDYYVEYIDSSIAQYFRKDNSIIEGADFESPEPLIRESYNTLGDTVILNKNIGLLLFSQFLRQQDSTMKGFYDLLVHTDIEEFKHKVFKATTNVPCTYIADESRFLRTIQNRMCWFSMSGANLEHPNLSWSAILDIMLKNMTNEQKFNLMPCGTIKLKDKNGKEHVCVNCKYYDDVKFRKEGVELRNLPCGILYMNSDYIHKRMSQDGNTIISQTYLDYYNKLNEDGIKSRSNVERD